MLAGHHLRAPRLRRARPMPVTEAGFSLIEVVVALGLISIVMAALTTFYVRAVAVTHQQGSRQVAIQLSLDGLDKIRALRGSQVAGALPGVETPQVNGLTYTRRYQALPCWQKAGPAANPTCLDVRPATPDSAYAELLRVVVTVTWPDRQCAGSSCSYSNSTLISSSGEDPVYRAGRTS